MYKYANNYDRQILEQKLSQEPFERTAVAFYRYVRLQDIERLRDNLYAEWNELEILGRVYVADEGINAQVSVPTPNLDAFRAQIDSYSEFKGVRFKYGLQGGQAFIKLTIKLKQQIVADGLSPEDYDLSNVGTHLEPEEWNEAMESPDTIVVDMRNHYESRIGHFENAITPDADSFREELPKVRETLRGKEEKKVLLYCTNGIRCEKASAYLKHHGFEDVNQLSGGINTYGHALKEGRINSKYRGKNFVFDERLAERITDEIISSCDQCGTKSDRQINCKNETCHLLFIQCEDCGDKMDDCCTQKCKDFAALPEEERRRLRKGNSHPTSKRRYRERLRPRLT